MKIIDAHTHVFDYIKGFGSKGELQALGNGKARWATGEVLSMIPEELGDKSFTGETLFSILKDNDVDKAILLQGSFYGFQNEYTYEVAKKYPDFFLAAGTLDPFCKAADQILDRLLHDFQFPIIKFETSSGGGLMGYHKEYRIDKEFSNVFDKIARENRTLVLDIGSPHMESFQPDAIARIATEYPDMHIIVCHLLAPTIHDADALSEALDKLQFDNVWFDLAAIPWNVAPETYPYPTGQHFIKMAAEIVGYQKLLWGTDVPSVLTKESYGNLSAYITQSRIFNEKELEAVFYYNALEAYPFA